MATNIENSKRRIVPRWHSFRVALISGELDPLEISHIDRTVTDEYLSKKKEEWENNRELLFATDFVGAAYVLGHEDIALDAAQFIIDSSDVASTTAISLAKKLLNLEESQLEKLPFEGDTPDIQLYKQINLLKKRRNDQPRSVFVWSDLARLYTILGLREQANNAMRTALILAPENRYVIRSAARLYLHLNDPESAHRMIASTRHINDDPWLLASEIAISSVLEKTSKYIKTGLGIIDKEAYAPFHLSELTSALASVELWNGSNKKAKRLFNRSLVSANENAIAQAAWASSYISIDGLSELMKRTQSAYEAIALIGYFRGDWAVSLDASYSWKLEEPFSRRPYTHISFILSEMYEEYSKSEEILTSALRIIPKDPTLLNNLAFVLIHQGKTEAAKRALDSINISQSPLTTKICILATIGLLNYRLGYVIEGREYYNRAISQASSQSLLQLKYRAMLYQAREELLANGLAAEHYRKRAIEQSRKLNAPELNTLITRLSAVKVTK